jgi:hypothetical protein
MNDQDAKKQEEREENRKDLVRKLLDNGTDKSVIRESIGLKRTFLNNRIAGIKKLCEVCDILEKANDKHAKIEDLSKVIAAVGKIVEN